MKTPRGHRLWPIRWLVGGLGILLSAVPGDAQRSEYVITFDNVVVQGIEGTDDISAVAHREVPKKAERESPDGAQREQSVNPQREPRGALERELPGSTQRKPLGAPERELMSPGKSPMSTDREADPAKGDGRAERRSPGVVSRSPNSQISFAPGKGTLNPSFTQEGFLVEAFWAVKTGSIDAYFKRAHFHPPDLSSGFEAQHVGSATELHGIFIKALDGKHFGLKSLRYRVTRNRELPNKPYSIEGFNNYNVNVLIARSFDPRGPIRAQFVSLPVGLPFGNDTGLPWWTLRIFGFELVSQVYIASSASVDFDNIVLTRSESSPGPPEGREEEK